MRWGAVLKPAYPYFGSKAAVAEVLWEAFGVDVPNFVDPACGSASVLFSRPTPGKIETVNDAHAFIPNFLRAVARDPEAVAHWAAWPVSEIDMHARHRWLVRHMSPKTVERLRDDPDFFDPKMAGWWVWGASIWIGGGWCDGAQTANGKRPVLAGGGGKGGRSRTGVGINRASVHLPHLAGPHNARKLSGQLPSLSGSDGSGVGYGRGIFASGRREDLLGYFQALADRLALVRITCGDWTRVVTEAVTISHGRTAVLLDPMYDSGKTKRAVGLYANDGAESSASMSSTMREWALSVGDNPLYRIALCGYEGEHNMPASWRVHAWKANGGYGNQGQKENKNASRERIWFSPFCLGGERIAGPLFELR